MTGCTSLCKINTDTSPIKRSNYNKLHSCSESWRWYDYWREKQVFCPVLLKCPHTNIHSFLWRNHLRSNQCLLQCMAVMSVFLKCKYIYIYPLKKKHEMKCLLGENLPGSYFTLKIYINNTYVYICKNIKVLTLSIILQHFCNIIFF